MPLLAPPIVIIRSRDQQQPADVDKPLLHLVYEHLKAWPHDFEQFAADIWRMSQPNVDRVDVTRPWRDGAATRSATTFCALSPIRLPLSSRWKRNASRPAMA